MPHTHRKYRAALKEALDRFSHLDDRTLRKCLDGVPLILTVCKRCELIVRGNTKIGQGLYVNLQEKIPESYPLLIRSFDITTAVWHRTEVPSCRRVVSSFLSQLLMNSEILDDLGYRARGYVSFSREMSDGKEIVESVHDMNQISLSIDEGGGKESLPVIYAFNSRESLKRHILDFERSRLCLESIATMSPVLRDLVVKEKEKEKESE